MCHRNQAAVAHFVHAVLLLHAMPFEQPEPTGDAGSDWGSTDEGPELVEATSSEEGSDQAELVEVTSSNGESGQDELVEVSSDGML